MTNNNPNRGKDKAGAQEGHRFIINVQESFESDRLRSSISSQTSSSQQQRPAPSLHVFVTAHPDDESMFFLPTMNALLQAGEIVWLLCLTSGNYDGLGDKRKAELSRVCHFLKLHKLICLDHKELQDHPTKAWSLESVTAQLKNALQTALLGQEETFQRIIFITFDEHGVSGHINHRDTHKGVRNLIQYYHNNKKSNSDDKSATTNLLLPPMEAWQLETVHFLPAKYIPIVGWLLILLYLNWLWKPTYTPFPNMCSCNESVNNNKVCYRSINPMLSWKAMATHESQFVWYRRLFVVFSCYTFVNKLRPIQYNEQINA